MNKYILKSFYFEIIYQIFIKFTKIYNANFKIYKLLYIFFSKWIIKDKNINIKYYKNISCVSLNLFFMFALIKI